MKYIPLEELLTYMKDRKTKRVWLGDSEEYVKNAEIYNMKIHFESLPTIDPIQIIDKMIEEKVSSPSTGFKYSFNQRKILEELKSRLSLTK